MSQPSKRQQILDTAGFLFMQNGFQSVTVDQIAAAVPVSKPTLYAHFKDKQDLFFTVIKERCELALQSLKAGINEGLSVEESLEAFGMQFLSMLLSKEALQFHRLIISESDSFPEMVQMFYESGPKPMHAVLEDYFKHLNRSKELKIADPAMASEIFISMIKSGTHFKCLLGIADCGEIHETDRLRLVKTVVKIFIHGQKT